LVLFHIIDENNPPNWTERTLKMLLLIESLGKDNCDIPTN